MFFLLLLLCCCVVVLLLHTERLDHLDHSCGVVIMVPIVMDALNLQKVHTIFMPTYSSDHLLCCTVACFKGKVLHYLSHTQELSRGPLAGRGPNDENVVVVLLLLLCCCCIQRGWTTWTTAVVDHGPHSDGRALNLQKLRTIFMPTTCDDT